jgi:lipid A 4'-phosphatase
MSKPYQLAAWVAVMWVVVGVVFYTNPHLDIAISALVFDAELRHFPYTMHPFWRFVQKAVSLLVWVWVGYLAWCVVRPRMPRLLQRALRKLPTFSLPQSAYLLASLAIGPGLLVHEFFKEFYGRARPELTTVFGGLDAFTPAFVISDSAGKSFVSGHSATAFYLTALVWCVPARWRAATFIVTLAIGVLVATGRVVQGRHFASDVILAGILAIFINCLLRAMWLKRWPNSLA